jgi:two-component sensor histidine kinase
MIITSPSSEHVCILVASSSAQPRLVRAFARRGHHVDVVAPAAATDAVTERVEAVLVAGARAPALALSQRLKTRFQVPFLPVVALASRPRGLPRHGATPDAWISATTAPHDIVARVEELVRIRRAERELVRLNTALAELAGENGRLYDRARRDAEATTVLLRELQHRVRNNLAAIQALLSLERHRAPPRPLPEAIDVAIARLRSMAALQDALVPHAHEVDLSSLAHAITRNTLDVFAASDAVQYSVIGTASLPSDRGSAVAIVLNELVTNTLKHAAAHRITIEIRGQAPPLDIDVSDDGCGMPAEPPPGSGLTIVRAVVANELRGELQFLANQPGTGVRIAIPA